MAAPAPASASGAEAAAADATDALLAALPVRVNTHGIAWDGEADLGARLTAVEAALVAGGDPSAFGDPPTVGCFFHGLVRLWAAASVRAPLAGVLERRDFVVAAAAAALKTGRVGMPRRPADARANWLVDAVRDHADMRLAAALLGAGFPPDLCTPGSSRPIYVAIAAEAVTLLAAHGADLDARDPQQLDPPLHCLRPPGVFEALVWAGADVNAVNVLGRRFTQGGGWAIFRTTAELRVLIDAGAHVERDDIKLAAIEAGEWLRCSRFEPPDAAIHARRISASLRLVARAAAWQRRRHAFAGCGPAAL